RDWRWLRCCRLGVLDSACRGGDAPRGLASDARRCPRCARGARHRRRADRRGVRRVRGARRLVPTRFALVVPFEGLAPVVDDLRERTCESKPSHGMPPHVSLLVPAPRDVEAIAESLFAFAAFEVVFARLERFPGTL